MAGENPIGGGPIGGGPIGPWPPEAEDVTLELEPASLVYEGQAVAFQYSGAVEVAEIAWEGQPLSFQYTFAVSPAEIAYEGQTIPLQITLTLDVAEWVYEGQTLVPATPATPLDVREIVVEGQPISFQYLFNVAHAEWAYEGQNLVFSGVLELDVAEIAYEGQGISFQYALAVAAAELVYEGQYVPVVVTFNLDEAALIVYQGQEIAFRQTVRPQLDRYPYCGRTGFRAPLGQLVEDGNRRGLFVDKRWADEPHPQDYIPTVGPDGARDRSAPPQDPVEEYEQVVLIVDGEEIEV